MAGSITTRGGCSTRGGCLFDELCEGDIQTYCCDNLADIRGLTKLKHTKKTLVAHINDVISAIEIGRGKRVSKIYIGKAFIHRRRASRNRYQILDPMDDRTWRKQGISGRWNEHKHKDYGKDGMVVLAAVTREAIPQQCRDRIHQQDYAFAIEQRLLHHFLITTADERVVNNSFATGGTDQNRSAAYAIYMAFALEDVVQPEPEITGDHPAGEEELQTSNALLHLRYPNPSQSSISLSLQLPNNFKQQDPMVLVDALSQQIARCLQGEQQATPTALESAFTCTQNESESELDGVQTKAKGPAQMSPQLQEEERSENEEAQSEEETSEEQHSPLLHRHNATSEWSSNHTSSSQQSLPTQSALPLSPSPEQNLSHTPMKPPQDPSPLAEETEQQNAVLLSSHYSLPSPAKQEVATSLSPPTDSPPSQDVKPLPLPAFKISSIESSGEDSSDSDLPVGWPIANRPSRNGSINEPIEIDSD